MALARLMPRRYIALRSEIPLCQRLIVGMALASTDSAFPWPPQPPYGWSIGGVLSWAPFWYLRQGPDRQGAGAAGAPRGIVVALLRNPQRGETSFSQEPFEGAVLRADRRRAWCCGRFVGSYCAASFRGDAYRRCVRGEGRTTDAARSLPQWQWGAFLLTGGWYVAHGMRVKGLWLLWLAFFTAVGSIVGIPLAFALSVPLWRGIFRRSATWTSRLPASAPRRRSAGYTGIS